MYGQGDRGVCVRPEPGAESRTPESATRGTAAAPAGFKHTDMHTNMPLHMEMIS